MLAYVLVTAALILATDHLSAWVRARLRLGKLPARATCTVPDGALAT